VGNRPLGVAVTPDGSNIYIANNNSPTFSRPGTVSVIDTATNTVIGSAIPVGISPDGVAVTPDGSKVYVSNGGSNISVINTATKMVMATIPVGASPVCFGLCIQPATPGAEIRGNAGEGELSSPERLGARQAVSRPQ
jgi:YVTN family beta-propeller protein